MFGKHWSLADGLASVWCNTICPGLFSATNRGPFKGQQASASNPVMWLWLAGLYVIEALPHMLPATRYPATSWPTIPRGYSTAAQPVYTGRRPSSDCGLACWTLNPSSGQSYCSFNSHTNSNSALVKYNLRASGWTHSTKLYPNIKICVHHILQQLVASRTTLYVFL